MVLGNQSDIGGGFENELAHPACRLHSVDHQLSGRGCSNCAGESSQAATRFCGRAGRNQQFESGYEVR